MTMEPQSSQTWAMQNRERNSAIQKVYYSNNMSNNTPTQIIQSYPQIINEKQIENDTNIVESIATSSPVLNPIIVDINGVTIKQNYSNSIVHHNPEIYTVSDKPTNETIREVENSDIKLPPVSEQSDNQVSRIVPLSSEGGNVNEEVIEDPAVMITINNVVCCFSTRCHLNLKKIAQEGYNAIYKRDCGVS